MLDYDWIDVSEGVGVNKTNGLCGHVNSHDWYFLKVNFRFRSKVYDGCRGLVQEVWNLKDVGDVAAKGNNNKIHFCYVNMDKAINIMKNSNLREKCRPF